MSQGTGIEALTRAYLSLAPAGKPTGGQSLASPSAASYLQIAHQALSIFTSRPRSAFRIGTPLGARYLQYSFAPGADIINAFLQSLIGLYDYAPCQRRPRGGGAVRRREPPGPGRAPEFRHRPWSLYQPGVLDTIDYHKLVTGFLAGALRPQTQAQVYCREATRFQSYLSHPPSSVS